MKILVTVGTTPFNSLIDHVLTLRLPDVKIQYADPKYNNLGIKGGVFLDNIETEYADADVIITHTGAGSTYKLLEMGKIIISVPNTERIDNHQLELAGYLEKNNYAIVIYDLNQLSVALSKTEYFFT
jgi:beta-1,4-N-acetylglucosaminyltransferase